MNLLALLVFAYVLLQLLLGVWVPPFLNDALHEAAGHLGGLP